MKDFRKSQANILIITDYLYINKSYFIATQAFKNSFNSIMCLQFPVTYFDNLLRNQTIMANGQYFNQTGINKKNLIICNCQEERKGKGREEFTSFQFHCTIFFVLQEMK